MNAQQQFEKDGYYLAKAVFDRNEISELEREFDRIVSQILESGEDVNARWSGPEVDRLGAAETVVLHTHNVQQYSAEWLRAFLHPRYLEVARQLLGDDIVLHHSKLFQKPAELGAPFPMHQDWGYFPSKLDTMLAAIIHVSEATDEMGCLRVYPGSHKLGRLHDTFGNNQMLVEKYPIEGATILEAEPGDVLFFHYFTIHGSMPNRSNQVRKTVLVQMHAGNDEIEEGCTHPNENLTISGFNHRMTRGRANQLK